MSLFPLPLVSTVLRRHGDGSERRTRPRGPGADTDWLTRLTPAAAAPPPPPDRPACQRRPQHPPAAATAGAVDNFVYEDAHDIVIADPEMQKRLLETNPNAFRDMVTTFLEANGRGYWDTDEANVELLQ